MGTLTLYRGFTSLYAAGKQVNADQVPQAWLDLTSASVAGVPAVVLIALATLVVIALRAAAGSRSAASCTRSARTRTAPQLIGIRVRRRVLGAFACSGLLAGFDGALWASRYATIDARVALGFELTVIAAVVVGGVAIRGGSGTVLGVALGALTLLVIKNGLTLVRVDPLWLQGVYGLVILVAIGIDAFVIRRTEARAVIARLAERFASWETFLARHGPGPAGLCRRSPCPTSPAPSTCRRPPPASRRRRCSCCRWCC